MILGGTTDPSPYVSGGKYICVGPSAGAGGFGLSNIRCLLLKVGQGKEGHWYGKCVSIFGCSDSVQRLSAAETLRAGRLISCVCVYLLSGTKRDLKPSRIQRYLGSLCNSSTTAFRVPEYNLKKLHALILAALVNGKLTVQPLDKIVAKCVSM